MLPNAQKSPAATPLFATLSLGQARALHLAAQGLLNPPKRTAKRADVLSVIERMALLQIDTIHVVSRSPYLVLHARLGDYPRAWLEEALAQGKIFETWAHEACFAPMPDVLLHRQFNRDARKHWGLAHAQKIHATQRPHLDKLLEFIRTHGAVKSSDFERPAGTGGAWWGWKDEKRWLEALFAVGELMVARREGFHRVYDLTERVAPDVLTAEALAGASGSALDAAQLRRHLVERSIAALGITQARWVNDYFRMKPRLKDADLDALVLDGTVLRMAVDGWDAPVYVHSTHTSLLKKAVAGKLVATHSALLSPFDPVVWDRERASTLFDFDYRLECYTPQPKRVYGYFVLPILCRGELIGRLDAKAHRADGVFEVKMLHAQPGRQWDEQQVMEVARTVARSAVWHGTPNAVIAATQPSGLAAKVRRALQTVRAGGGPY